MTPTGEPGPDRLQEILEPGLPGAGRAHVLEHPELPVPAQHAPDFQKAPAWIGDAAEDEAAQDRVEGRVAKREGLGAPDHEGHPRGAAPGALQRRPRRLEADGARVGG
jgi:hypothetical protein